MILFILIIIAEMLICAFRSTRKNIVRLICNIGSVLLAGVITLIIASILKKILPGKIGIDLTFNGNLSKADAGKLDMIVAAFAAGVISSVVYAVIYWILKLVSIIITRAVLGSNDKSDSVDISDNADKSNATDKTAFNPLGLAFGLVIGIICAGFTTMPYTGLQQLFTNKESGQAVADLVTQYVGTTEGKLVKISSSPRALTLSKCTGIGFITNAIFNSFTTAKTDAGEESLVEFAKPYIANIDDLVTFTDKNAEYSELLFAGSGALDVLSETKLFTEKEKLNMIENVVRHNAPDVPIPEYKTLSSLSEDVTCAGNIVGIFEKIIPHNNRDNLIDSINLDTIDLGHDDIVKLADNLYSMNEGGFYVNLIFEKVFGGKAHIDTNGDAFKSTKQSFIDILESAMKLKDVINTDIQDISDINLDELKDTVKNIKDSDLVTEEEFHKIINNVKESIKESNIDFEEIKKMPELQGLDLSGYDSIDDIPDELIDSLLK